MSKCVRALVAKTLSRSKFKVDTRLLSPFRRMVYSENDSLLNLKNNFRDAGFDFDSGLETLNNVLDARIGRNFDLLHDSVHWLIFSCLSIRKPSPVRILEIGTYNGVFTAILADLFPEAQIVTIDLPESDPLFRTTYDRSNDETLEIFLKQRQANLQKSNIEFVQVNSAFMLDVLRGTFDAVWVDGGHLFPEVAWDLATAHFLCKEGGSLFCDDVIPANNGYRTRYVSRESYEILCYLSERTHQPVRLFIKRCSASSSSKIERRKFVAMMEVRSPVSSKSTVQDQSEASRCPRNT